MGIVTPVVNLNPRFDPPPWERDGGIDDVLLVARAAERLGVAPSKIGDLRVVKRSLDARKKGHPRYLITA
ncbi:MAG TPA: hypothetical protein VN768_00150, partial [Acidimicrobiales bacterium]|nr:hypothetical protein [Acidimicrobiales bacterium]